MANIKFSNVHKSFGTNKIIADFNLKGKDDEFLVLVGPSGCGKSTLLRMIAGLEKIDEGEIHINDQLINNLHPSKRLTAMVFQSYALYPHMNVYENMSFGLKIEKKTKEEKEIVKKEKAKEKKLKEKVTKKKIEKKEEKIINPQTLDDYPEQYIAIDEKSKEYWKSYRPMYLIGEEFKFEIGWSIFKAGTATIRTMPMATMGGKEVLHVNGLLESAEYFEGIYKLKDTLDVYVDIEKGGFSPLKYEMKQRESGQLVDDLQLFDYLAYNITDDLNSVQKTIKNKTDLKIPIQKKARSLNIVSSVAITLAEALKQNQCL